MKPTEIYKQIPQSTCPPNCGECCGIVWPSMAELQNIKEWCERKHIEFKDFNMVVGVDCPYLTSDKRCAIYPVRPFLCRILGVGSDIPCPLKLNRPVKILNHAQSNWCYKQIYLKGKQKPITEKHRKLISSLLRNIDD